MSKDVQLINDYLAGVIKNRVEGGEAEGDGQDLISLFMASCEKDGRVPEPDELRDLIMSFVIAGRDTTASLLTWTFYLLTGRKEMMQRARQETREKEDDYDSMSWTQAVLYEALRLYPSVPLEFKTAREDDTLPCGTFVPAGTRVMYNPYVVNRNPANFDEPNDFRPQRWLEEDGACRKPDLKGFAYPAFNAGPRVCLGRQMAMMEAKVVVSHLLDAFDFDLEPGFVPSTKFTVVLAARHGMRVNATPLE
jgi:cytochrome P450